MKKDNSRRRFLAATALAAAATTSSQRLAANDVPEGEGPSMEGRIFKAVKGGKKNQPIKAVTYTDKFYFLQ